MQTLASVMTPVALGAGTAMVDEVATGAAEETGKEVPTGIEVGRGAADEETGSGTSTEVGVGASDETGAGASDETGAGASDETGAAVVTGAADEIGAAEVTGAEPPVLPSQMAGPGILYVLGSAPYTLNWIPGVLSLYSPGNAAPLGSVVDPDPVTFSW
jgi:hypothetical protein